MRNTHFSEYDLNREIYNTLAHGDIEKIANAIGKSPDVLRKQLNPDNEKTSPLALAAFVLHALIGINEDRGLDVLHTFVNYVESGIRESTTREARFASYINQTHRNLVAIEKLSRGA